MKLYTHICIHSAIDYKVLTGIYKYFTLEAIFVLSHLWSIGYSLVDTCLFSQCLWSFKSYSLIFLYLEAIFFSFHIYDHLRITCLVDIFVFGNAHEVLHHIHKYFKFCNHICSFTSLIVPIFLAWHTFFSFMPITFEIVHTCLSIHNAYAFEISCDN